jgi:hypothetical protein
MLLKQKRRPVRTAVFECRFGLSSTRADRIALSEVSRRGIALADEYGDAGTAPVVGGIIVRFNGVGPAAHESFRMERFFSGPPHW